MFTLHRIALPLINAFIVTGVLLYFMYSLIHIDEPELLPNNKLVDLRWPQLPEETELNVVATKPTPPKEIELAPDHIVDAPEPISVINSPTNWGDFVIKKPAGVLVTPNDSQLVLALGYPPVYPNSAITKGIEGFAVVGFSVSPAGQVYDAFIIESEPNSIFDRSALKAIKKTVKPWPLMVNAIYLVTNSTEVADA